jgi:hypothetical protein
VEARDPSTQTTYLAAILVANGKGFADLITGDEILFQVHYSGCDFTIWRHEIDDPKLLPGLPVVASEWPQSIRERMARLLGEESPGNKPYWHFVAHQE